MNTTTARSFSLVRAVLDAASASGVTIRTLGSNDLVSTEPGLTAGEFEERLGAMRVWCRSVERLLVKDAPADLRMHAGFERLSRLVPVFPRYRRLAAAANSLVVYGLPDHEVGAVGMRVVPLDSGPLVNEWFVVAKAKGFGAVIAAEDLDGFGGGVPLGERRFRGIVSHHPTIVSAAMEAMDGFAAARGSRAPSPM